MWGRLTVNSAADAYTDLIQLPAGGYRPRTHTVVKVPGDYVLDVRSDGRIQCHTALSSGTNIPLAVTYLS